MKLNLTGTLVCPAVEGVDNALETILDHILSKGTITKSDLEHTVNVIPETLILPKFCQDGHNRGKHMLGPKKGSVSVKQGW